MPQHFFVLLGAEKEAVSIVGYFLQKSFNICVIIHVWKIVKSI